MGGGFSQAPTAPYSLELTGHVLGNFITFLLRELCEGFKSTDWWVGQVNSGSTESLCSVTW